MPVQRSIARSLAIIDYSILSILSVVDIGRRARVLDVIVTSYPVSAATQPASPCVQRIELQMFLNDEDQREFGVYRW